MKSKLAWIGFLWIGAVALAAIACCVYAIDWVISRDTTVLPWLLLPAAAVIILAAFVAAVPGVILLAYLGTKETQKRMMDSAQPTLDQLMKREDKPV